MRIKRKPKYKDQYHEGRPATRWALLEKFTIGRVPGDPYLIRWRIVHTPWFGILLHRIEQPDPDQHVHNHPWAFISIVLRGGYQEKFKADQNAETEWHTWKPFSIHKMNRGSFHKIMRLIDKPTYTLIITGPRRHEWGFLVDETNEVVNWKTYLGLEHL